MLGWVSQFNIFLLLDNQDYAPGLFHQHEFLLAVGSGDVMTADPLQLRSILKQDKWYFGHLNYELTDSLHGTSASKQDKIGFPSFYFFEPSILLQVKNGQLFIDASDPEAVYAGIMAHEPQEAHAAAPLQIRSGLNRESYISKIKALQEHIQRGDCYEINFCQEFFSEDVTIEPHHVFMELMKVSPNPFSAFYRINDSYLLCASPERFLLKKGNKLVSQPIKGTIKRDLQDKAMDEQLAQQLRNSQKEQSENVMVVDLVRNDLSRICRDGTVKVDELFGIYSFPQVHQMISTISGELLEEKDFYDILKACFPMGSMTGAPKTRVMELVEAYEDQARGIFSGCVGFIAPGGDFDLNVVIRSIMYNAGSKYLSYQVGSGITIYSDPESEWEECLLKAEAIKKVLAIS
jgi:para-aminobenzoate synthetase component I